MKRIFMILAICSMICSGQFFEEEKVFFSNESYENESQLFFENYTEYETDFPDLGTDSGQPGDPTGVPIRQPIPLLLISAIMIGIFYWMKMKT